MLLDLKTLFTEYNLSFNGVVHVGANVGEERHLYKKLGLLRQVWFEPNPGCYQRLKFNVAANNQAVAFQVACGSERGTAKLNVASNDGQSSSLLAPKLHLLKHSDVLFPGWCFVNVVTLDEFLPEYDIDPADYLLVLDTQGYEGEVLKGAEKLLHKFGALVVELNKEELYEGVILVYEIDSFLTGCGFTRVETKWTAQSWGDGLFIKK